MTLGISKGGFLYSIAGLQKGRLRASWIGVAWGVFVLLAACSSPGGSPPTPTAPPVATPTPGMSTPPPAVGVSPSPVPPMTGQVSPQPPAATGGEIKVTLWNHHFPEEIRVKAGAKVVFVITNEGDETHSFEFPDLDVYKEIKPGQTMRFEWVVPDRKGKWDMGCFLTDPQGVHEDMEGTLIIE